MDLTPYFAPFFTLFFGMCLGDVGYGLLIFLALTFLQFNKRFLPYRKALLLGQFLGVSAIIFGALTGTIFGADLSNTTVPFLETLKWRFLTVDELFNLSLLIGLVQILFGMGIRVVNRSRMFGWMYGLSSIGWILGVLGGIAKIGFDWSVVGYILITIGLLFILLFSDPGKGIFTRLGLGIWDLYGITGLFGDVLSYVRLFALGLSSGILGLVVNNIAFSILDGGTIVGYPFFVIVLLFGHGLNFAISTLSAFVHPIRLTFVEFYKSAGFIGGGEPYKPFSKHKTNLEI
jgi:V/A-type H+-transporting ATPase subunit I